MARRLPGPLRRREILYGTNTPTEALVGLGEEYLEQGLVFDAVDFFAQARDREGLVRVKRLAVEAGDAFLLRRVHETVADLVNKSDWEELARRARALGKDVYAERAEVGGTPPPPPLQEELAMDKDEPADEKGPGAGPKDSAERPRPGAPGRGDRRREVQGG